MIIIDRGFYLLRSNNVGRSSNKMLSARATTNYDHLRLQRITIVCSSYALPSAVTSTNCRRTWLFLGRPRGQRNAVGYSSYAMSAAAPMKCRRPAPTNYNHLRLQWNAIGRSSNESRSFEATMKYHRPRLQRNTIDRGSYKNPQAVASTNYLRPRLLLIMSAAARIKCRRPWLLRIIVHTIIYFKKNNGRLSETSILGDNFRVVFGPIAHLGRHWHGSLQPEKYAHATFGSLVWLQSPQPHNKHCLWWLGLSDASGQMAVIMLSNVSQPRVCQMMKLKTVKWTTKLLSNCERWVQREYADCIHRISSTLSLWTHQCLLWVYL